MKKFQFYQDVKCTVWQRQFFEIEAETEDEAKRIAFKYKDSDVSSDECMKNSEWLFDTEELMTPEENDGQSTIELYLDGEETPFVSNGSDESKMAMGAAYCDQYKDPIRVAFCEMGRHTVECSYQGNIGVFQAYHDNGKLVIIHLRTPHQVYKYTFAESRDSLVNQNEDFRKRMVAFLTNEGGNYLPTQDEIHDWLAGHLTAMVPTSPAVDDCAPFTLEDVIDVWGTQAVKHEYQPAKLVGYQIIDNEDELADGWADNQIIVDRQKAWDAMTEKYKADKGKKEYALCPVYEHDIPNPVYI